MIFEDLRILFFSKSTKNRTEPVKKMKSRFVCFCSIFHFFMIDHRAECLFRGGIGGAMAAPVEKKVNQTLSISKTKTFEEEGWGVEVDQQA